ncbi:ribonuclease HI family protein [Specibacter cremeus]|uniref:ribonuclease HI family protein n=1 Tax=Specibacter cremeus TaxID=1629051 RepID=UPI000F771EBC|nr:ribonuclease HI family protein [Specibacter cremeus]
MTIVAAADGSALGNPGPAGWAWYVDDTCWRAGGWPHGTNNQGELMAVLDLFNATAHLPDEPLRILCDSQYVINCVTKWMPGWKRKGWRKADGKAVLNQDLLKQIDDALVGRKYTFEWIKGHAGHDLNEAADDRARDAALAYQAGRTPVTGPGFRGPAAAGAATGHAVGARHAAGAAPVAAMPEPARDPRDDQPDLFTVFEDDVFEDDAPDPAFGEPAPTTSPDAVLDAVIALERELLTPDTRADAGRLAFLLHPEFEEIGASGRLWDRDDMIAALVEGGSGQANMDLMGAAMLDDATALLTYRSFDRRGTALRSSLWRRDGTQWRLRFHQGTPER